MRGISIGIDFGSTNSIVFLYDEEQKRALPVDVVSGSSLVPSVVSFDSRTKMYDYGLSAKNTDSKRVKVFKAFKMLLSEKNVGILQDRNYDPVPDEFLTDEEKKQLNTAENITRIFLKNIIEEVLIKTGADYIENLVVGFPEVWNNIETASARFILKEICTEILQDVNSAVKGRSGITVKSHVQVRTEPECASAFIAKQLEKENGQNYNGNILIIDYGGGTLDITLSNIVTNKEGFMEIDVLARQGAGENSRADKQIGNAGIIYMESIIEEALRKADVFEAGEVIPHDNKFYKAVNALENAMLGMLRKKLELTFKVSGVDEEALEELMDDDMTEWLFCSVDYDGAGEYDELLIPYSLMAECYNRVIAPTLEKHLRLIMQDMAEHNIPFRESGNQNFKVAIVGGFGRYYPVREQIQKMFNVQHVDDIKMVKMSEDESELAIAHGACLFSKGILKIRKTARLEIGTILPETDNIQIAIKYGDEIDSGKINYCKDKKGNLYKYWLDGDDISEFWINYTDKEEGGHRGILKKHVKQQLEGIKDLKGLPVLIGFSMDDSELLSMHIQYYNQSTGHGEGKIYDFKLDRYDKIFDFQAFV